MDHIDLLIPTIDADLLVLSQNTAKFDEVGTKVLMSKPEKIAICRDKNYTADLFESCDLKAPRTLMIISFIILHIRASLSQRMEAAALMHLSRK